MANDVYASISQEGKPKLSIEDVDVKRKRVFVRTDFNVPLDAKLQITDDTRIRATLPTINYLLDEDAKVILGSHLGRPKGKPDPRLSLNPVARRLARLLAKEVRLAPDCVGPEVKDMVGGMREGDVILLENLRFHPGETQNEEAFARELVSLAEVYIGDAFGNCHRRHASMDSLPRMLKPAAAGFLIEKEVNYLSRAINNPMRPVVAILGGAKASTKIAMVENLAERVDKIIIGGGMAFTFFKAQGLQVGKSMVENDLLEVAAKILRKAADDGIKLYLPVDCVVADKFEASAETKVVPVQEIPEDWYALDIGPASTTLFGEALQNAKTIIWNGPMGVFEVDAFSRGTFAMVYHVANSYALTIVGGGDTDVAVHRAGESSKISYISTGGGSFMEFLEGNELPGLASLTDKDQTKGEAL